jgi:hypothetical protein
MKIGFISAMFCGVLLVPATTTVGFAQMGGYTPSASASSREIAEHASTVRAEILYAKCKERYGVWPETKTIRAPNSLTYVFIRNGGKRI